MNEEELADEIVEDLQNLNEEEKLEYLRELFGDGEVYDDEDYEEEDEYDYLQ